MSAQREPLPEVKSRVPQFDPALVAAPVLPPPPPVPESILPESILPAPEQAPQAPEGAPALSIARDRRPVKVTLYIDQALADRLEDTTLVWQRRHRRRKKLEKGMVADALLAAGLDHLTEAEAWLKTTYVR